MEIDTFTKLSQAAFYIVGGTVAVLTYLKAKNGLLNTVNTEYHKKVIERLSTLSEDLYREFDDNSDDAWLKDESVKEVVDLIHEEYLPQREAIIAEGIKDPPTPMSNKEVHIHNLAKKYRSVPFLPEEIRARVVALLEKRSEAMHDAFRNVLEAYQVELGQGKHWNSLADNQYWIHNKIVERLYELGAGISQVEEEVHAIRFDIQKYFTQFNPLA